MYTIRIRVTKVDDRILLKAIIPLLIWGAAFFFILLIPDVVLAGVLVIIWIILFVPIIIFSIKNFVLFRQQEYKNKTLRFDVIDGRVFMEENEVDIMMNQESQFIIHMKNFDNYAVARSDTKPFFEFLEANEIPYIGYAFDCTYVPDGVSHDEWEYYLIKFLSNYKGNVTEENRMYMLEQLEEFASRETYEIVDERIEKALSTFLLKYIDFENFEIMDSVTFIVINIGLKSLWNEILLKKDTIANSSVVKMIEECDEKYGAHIENPYFSYISVSR